MNCDAYFWAAFWTGAALATVIAPIALVSGALFWLRAQDRKRTPVRLHSSNVDKMFHSKGAAND